MWLQPAKNPLFRIPAITESPFLNSNLHESWVRINDPYQQVHAIMSYGAFDYSDSDKVVDRSNEILIAADPSRLEFWIAGHTYYCTDPRCVLFRPGTLSNYTHVALAWSSVSLKSCEITP